MAQKRETRELRGSRASDAVRVTANAPEVTLLAFDLQAFWLSRRRRVSRELAAAIAELAFSKGRASA
jgi:hypothetical protein